MQVELAVACKILLHWQELFGDKGEPGERVKDKGAMGQEREQGEVADKV